MTCGATRSCSTTGRLDGFVTRFAASGGICGPTFLGGTETDFVLAVAVDSSGQATSGIEHAQPRLSDDRRSGVAQPSPDSTFISGEGSEYAIQVALDSSGSGCGTSSAGPIRRNSPRSWRCSHRCAAHQMRG